MAGKEDSGSEICWRKEVDQNLKHLQALLYGADVALEKKDYASAQVLLLMLIGFLDSHSRSCLDEAFIRPIRREAVAKLQTARCSLIPHSDRQVFAQAGKGPGAIFKKRNDIDLENVMQSKYFQSFYHQPSESNSGTAKQLEKRDKSTTFKNLIQTKLPSSYRNAAGENKYSAMKNALSDDCIILGQKGLSNNNRSTPCTPTIPVLMDHVDEDAHGANIKTKRLHREMPDERLDKEGSPYKKEGAHVDASTNGFVTARAKLEMEAKQKRGFIRSPSESISPQVEAVNQKGNGARSYGFSRRGVRGNFVPPIKSSGNTSGTLAHRGSGKSEDALDESTRKCLEMLCGPDGELPEKLRNIEPRLIEHISNEIMERDPNVRWDDIAGLDHAKKCVTEMVIWPLLRPDIFQGCRSPGRGLLLFGPPGTGKTMIGKAIAGEAKATFFYISASSLTSKWIGEGEKLVRALFGVASCRQPAVIFVDEIDSLLSQRKSDGEHEASRRLKTQFLIEMEGFDSGNEQILLIGATNRPQELDEAARRRLTKRLYIPLPTSEARAWIIKNLLDKDGLLSLTDDDIDAICNLTDGYSGSDMKNLVKDATMGPLREALKQGTEITKLRKDDMRPVNLEDFEKALQEVRPSVSLSELGTYERWNEQFGSLSL